MERTAIQERLAYWKGFYAKLQAAYIALVEGKVKSYMIDDRQLTYHSLSDLKDAMDDAEDKIDELEAALEGRKPRKAVGIVIRDW